MKTKSPRQKLMKSNDTIFRKLILHRDNYTCQKTGKKNNLQVAHIFTRKNLRLRWELDNAVTLNGGNHYFWAHVNPIEFHQWWKEKIGEKRYEILLLKKRYCSPVRINELKGYNLYLKQELSKIEGT